LKPLVVAGPSEATDSQLVVAARGGSDIAFEALFRRYRDRITAYVRSIVKDHARAEDIVQDVFMSALRSLRSSDREIAFKPWIYEIAKNACIDYVRKARRTAEVSIDSDDFSPVDEGRMSVGVASSDAAYSAREELDALRMAFGDLPDAQREVLVSRELEGLSYDGISRRTGLSRSAVESMLFRARRTLKDGFDDIATGERCQRMQTVMVHLTDGRIGLRQERRLLRHLDDCAACRREAVALGLDDLVLRAPSRTKSVLSRVAGLLPLPAFFRRRWLDASSLAGSAGQGTAEGASLAGKAAVVLAAAAIAGGGAGVAHKAGVIGDPVGSKAAAPAGKGPSSSGPSNGGGGRTAAGGGSAGQAGGGSAPGKGGGDGRGSGASSPGAGGGTGNGSGPHGGGPLGDTGSTLKNAGDQGGAAAGGILNGGGGGVNGAHGTIGGAVDGAGGVLNDTTKGVGETIDKAGQGVGGAVDKVAPGVGGTVNKTVQGTTGTVNGVVQGTTGAVNGVVGTVLPPSQQAGAAPAPPLLPKLKP
jgi:RNA polymerase sigma factor (sigma-70 family)